MTIAVEETAVGTAARADSSVTVTLAGAPSDGELIVLGLVVGDGGTSDGTSNLGTNPSGFSRVDYATATAGQDKLRHVALWYKVAGASEPTSYSFTSYSVGSSDWVKKSLFAIVASASAGEFAGLQAEKSSAVLNETASATVSRSITPTVNDSLLVAIAGFGVDGIGNISWDSLFTTADEDDNVPSVNDYVAGSAYRVVTTAATFSPTATNSASRTYQGMVLAAFNSGSPTGDAGDVIGGAAGAWVVLGGRRLRN